MNTNFNIPENLTEEQIECLEAMADYIIGEGEEAGASQRKISVVIAKEQKKYLDSIRNEN